jgi:hypothetical protein
MLRTSYREISPSEVRPLVGSVEWSLEFCLAAATYLNTVGGRHESPIAADFLLGPFCREPRHATSVQESRLYGQFSLGRRGDADCTEPATRHLRSSDDAEEI